jgi:hypothetical protein
MAPGFFEYEHQAGGDLLVTLLRCVGQLSREDLTTRPGHAGWPVPTPGAQCLGRERIQLALALVSADEVERAAPLAQLWEDAFVPPRAIWLRQPSTLDPAGIDLRLEGEGLVFSSLKPAEGDSRRLVFRCYNATGARVEGRLIAEEGLGAVARTLADEREVEWLALEQGGRAVRFAAGPHEIVSLAVVSSAVIPSTSSVIPSTSSVFPSTSSVIPSTSSVIPSEARDPARASPGDGQGPSLRSG